MSQGWKLERRPAPAHEAEAHSEGRADGQRDEREARCCLLPWDYFMMVEEDDDQLLLVFRDFVRFLGDVFYCFSLAKYDCTYTLKVKDTEKEKWHAMGTVEVQMVQPEGDGMSVYDRLLVTHLY
jgi:hypothetical protein